MNLKPAYFWRGFHVTPFIELIIDCSSGVSGGDGSLSLMIANGFSFLETRTFLFLLLNPISIDSSNTTFCRAYANVPPVVYHGKSSS
ncbi:TPA: hypothetical protein ACJTJC_004752, partial [Klebsiella pneumoniae]